MCNSYKDDFCFMSGHGLFWIIVVPVGDSKGFMSCVFYLSSFGFYVVVTGPICLVMVHV